MTQPSRGVAGVEPGEVAPETNAPVRKVVWETEQGAAAAADTGAHSEITRFGSGVSVSVSVGVGVGGRQRGAHGGRR